MRIANIIGRAFLLAGFLVLLGPGTSSDPALAIWNHIATILLVAGLLLIGLARWRKKQ